jgi:hypothetical protein
VAFVVAALLGLLVPVSGHVVVVESEDLAWGPEDSWVVLSAPVWGHEGLDQAVAFVRVC